MKLSSSGNPTRTEWLVNVPKEAFRKFETFGKSFYKVFRLLAAFQQKLILPTFCLSLAIGVAGYFMPWSTPIVQGIGFGYFLAGPLTHYFAYELKNINEYYFYFNLGMDKTILCASTIGLNLILGGLILFHA